MKKLAVLLTLALTASLTAVAFDVEVHLPGSVESNLSTTVTLSVAEGLSARSFDEALWTALGNVANIEYQLPENLTTLDVEIRAGVYVPQTMHLVFERDDFQQLIAGLVSPAMFLRESVEISF